MRRCAPRTSLPTNVHRIVVQATRRWALRPPYLNRDQALEQVQIRVAYARARCLMSARMPRSVGNHDSMTYTKMIMLYASESDTIRYFKLSMRCFILLTPGRKPGSVFQYFCAVTRCPERENRTLGFAESRPALAMTKTLSACSRRLHRGRSKRRTRSRARALPAHRGFP